MTMICSRARQCKQTPDTCYHKRPHDINNPFCINHICKFNQIRTVYESFAFEINMLTNEDIFTCIEIIYK